MVQKPTLARIRGGSDPGVSTEARVDSCKPSQAQRQHRRQCDESEGAPKFGSAAPEFPDQRHGNLLLFPGVMNAANF